MKSYKIKFGYKAVQLKAGSFKQAITMAAPILGYSLTDTMVRSLVKCESIN